MKTQISFAVLLLTTLSLFEVSAQDSIPPLDSTRILQEVLVHGYLYDRPLSEVPASIAIITRQDLERFSNTSILPVVNTIPGVRMEERSPGSYRFSIRGSLLRSPFGVRNVKLYWNGLPLTDGGGNTYLNLIDFNAVTSTEIIKGPGGSLYGAGTGGVVLLNKTIGNHPSISVSSVFGSYGLQRYQFQGEAGNDKVKASVQYTHQQADGYREQTRMRRDAFNGDITFVLGSKSSLSATLFYTDLFYQTPGGLTKAQYDDNPTQARPPKTTPPPQPGAVETKAAVENKTGYGGIIYNYDWNDHWTSKTGVYGSVTSFQNPTIRNYESRDEDNVGARHETQYDFNQNSWKGKITFGGEYQYFFSPVQVYTNSNGDPGNIQSDDELKSKQLLLFAQAEFELPRDFFVTIGGSGTYLKYDYLAKLPAPVQQERKFDPVFSPRVAVLKKFGPNVSVFASLSKGFSPPSLAEVRPSAGTYNNSLKPERGISYEAGLRGGIFRQQVTFDMAVYDFELDETIVIQRTADGAEFFVNAGETSQRGIEAKVAWSPVMTSKTFSYFKLWSSYTYNHYRFTEYVQDAVDYSGNRLTGIAPTIAVIGVDISLWKFYINLTGSYTDAIPLNDANTEYASAYTLLGARLGYKTNLSQTFPLDLFVGMDNALDETYSLGNDLNAIGGRYYNSAAGRNVYVGLVVKPFFPAAHK
ncbi:MAG TPA: TonB-dependent receptor [Chryseolinea sp.]|nr:TonB-dependent receptor [Chryseolinea sp.]